jgi:DNA-binding SARP family transcriptional activator
MVSYRLPGRGKMKQTIQARQERPLLNYAISKLEPCVFTHPVLVRFGNLSGDMLPQITWTLQEEAEKLQPDHPADACQIYLICAAYKNYSGYQAGALAILEEAADLATNHGLSQEYLWAICGQCAICIQERNYEQAIIHFEELRHALYQQNEWILADYFDVVRQSLLGSSTRQTKNNLGFNRELEPLLSSTFDWFFNWGAIVKPEIDAMYDSKDHNKEAAQENITRSLPYTQSQQGPWHVLKLMFSGELRLLWKSDSISANSQSSLWGAILNSLRVHFFGQNRDTATIDIVPPASEPNPPLVEVGVEQDPIPLPAPKPDQSLINLADIDQPQMQATIVIRVSVHMLGKFELSIQDMPCKLPATRNLSLLKYLLLHHKQNTPREVLMDVFWPEATPETARNNLNVAMHNLRKNLRTVIFLPLIVYEDGAYGLDSSVQVWLDVEEFERCIEAGKHSEMQGHLNTAVKQYESAISLYEGDFLEQNPYEEWTIHDRERLRIVYLDTVDHLSQVYFSQENFVACITACQRILSYDQCREDVYCLLMRCYSRQGQDFLALRQYQNCVRSLWSELGITPAPATTRLFQQIREHRPV